MNDADLLAGIMKRYMAQAPVAIEWWMLQEEPHRSRILEMFRAECSTPAPEDRLHGVKVSVGGQVSYWNWVDIGTRRPPAAERPERRTVLSASGRIVPYEPPRRGNRAQRRAKR